VYAVAQRTYLIFLAFTVRHAGHEAATALGDTSPA
jgi:hypothetical protein